MQKSEEHGTLLLRHAPSAPSTETAAPPPLLITVTRGGAEYAKEDEWPPKMFPPPQPPPPLPPDEDRNERKEEPPPPEEKERADEKEPPPIRPGGARQKQRHVVRAGSRAQRVFLARVARAEPAPGGGDAPAERVAASAGPDEEREEHNRSRPREALHRLRQLGEPLKQCRRGRRGLGGLFGWRL